jgi:hypothetical protein
MRPRIFWSECLITLILTRFASRRHAEAQRRHISIDKRECHPRMFLTGGFSGGCQCVAILNVSHGDVALD